MITALVIPFSTANTVMRTFKVMPRHQVGMELIIITALLAAVIISIRMLMPMSMLVSVGQLTPVHM